MEVDHLSPAPGWGYIKQHDLTPDFVQFVNGLHEIEEVKSASALGLRHFRVNDFSIEERVIKFYYDYVVKGEFEAREDDVFVVSFPKTGTTWLQEIVYLINTDFDYEKAKSAHLFERFPFMEAQFTPKKLVLEAPSPRHIKSHLPLALLPPSIMEKKCKIIYIARNPKDTIVSFYHFLRLQTAWNFKGSFEDFVDFFMNETAIYGPYDVHALQFWEIRNEHNILFLKYEELKMDLPKEIRKIASFLGKPVNDEQVEKLSKHCSFEEMKRNRMCNDAIRQETGFFNGNGEFFRRGAVGDWKTHMDDVTNGIMEKYYVDKFKSKGLTFDFEL